MNKIIDGKLLALEIEEQLKKEVTNLVSIPQLVIIQVGDNEASKLYVKNKEKACQQIGIDCNLIKFCTTIDNKEIGDKIIQLNNDDNIHGIIVQLPLPKHLDSQKIINLINPIKDVDGLTSTNIGNLTNNIRGHIPCTALGIIALLNKYNINVNTKHVVLVGKSNLVGTPLIKLLLNEGATVTVCHSKSKPLEYYTKQADILIVAVGKKHLIKKEMIKKDVILIDVGINRVNNQLFGDIDYEDVYNTCSLITPVPGGVGPMTVIMLMGNILAAYQLLKKTD